MVTLVLLLLGVAQADYVVKRLFTDAACTNEFLVRVVHRPLTFWRGARATHPCREPLRAAPPACNLTRLPPPPNLTLQTRSNLTSDPAAACSPALGRQQAPQWWSAAALAPSPKHLLWRTGPVLARA